MNASGSQMLEVRDGKPVRPRSGRVFALIYDGGFFIGGERSEGVVEFVLTLYLSKAPAEDRVE